MRLDACNYSRKSICRYSIETPAQLLHENDLRIKQTATTLLGRVQLKIKEI